MEQAEAVWDGVFISDREDSEHKILIYQIDAFYVEVYFHKDVAIICSLLSIMGHIATKMA